MSAILRLCQNFCDSLYEVPERYNRMQEEIDRLEETGRIFVIRPEQPVRVSRLEQNLSEKPGPSQRRNETGEKKEASCAPRLPGNRLSPWLKSPSDQKRQYSRPVSGCRSRLFMLQSVYSVNRRKDV